MAAHQAQPGLPGGVVGAEGGDALRLERVAVGLGAFAFADQRAPSTAVIAPSASTTGVVRTAVVTASRKAGSAIVEASAAGSSPARTTAVAPARVLDDQPLLPWTTVVTLPVQPAFFTACA